MDDKEIPNQIQRRHWDNSDKHIPKRVQLELVAFVHKYRFFDRSAVLKGIVDIHDLCETLVETIDLDDDLFDNAFGIEEEAG